MSKLALISALLLFPHITTAQQTPNTAQHPTDPKWNAWLGCWELVVENARDSAARTPAARRPLATSAATRPQVCVQPSGAGVVFSTRVAGQSAIEQTVI